MGDRFGALLQSLMALALAIVDRNPKPLSALITKVFDFKNLQMNFESS